MNKQTLDIQARDLKIVHDILQKYLPPQARVFAFGSRVKGRAKKFSDLDLAIDNNGIPLSPLILAEINFDFEGSDLPYKVDIVDWNAISHSFQDVIKEHYQVLKIAANMPSAGKHA